MKAHITRSTICLALAVVQMVVLLLIAGAPTWFVLAKIALAVAVWIIGSTAIVLFWVNLASADGDP